MLALGCPLTLQINTLGIFKFFVDVFLLLAGALLRADAERQGLYPGEVGLSSTHERAFYKASCKRVFVLREPSKSEAVC